MTIETVAVRADHERVASLLAPELDALELLGLKDHLRIVGQQSLHAVTVVAPHLIFTFVEVKVGVRAQKSLLGRRHLAAQYVELGFLLGRSGLGVTPARAVADGVKVDADRQASQLG